MIIILLCFFAGGWNVWHSINGPNRFINFLSWLFGLLSWILAFVLLI